MFGEGTGDDKETETRPIETTTSVIPNLPADLGDLIGPRRSHGGEAVRRPEEKAGDVREV